MNSVPADSISEKPQRWVFRQEAEEGTKWEAGAFNKAIGRPVRVTTSHGREVTGTLIDVRVVGDGRYAMVTVDIPASSLNIGDVLLP